jgi:hypothetical protein
LQVTEATTNEKGLNAMQDHTSEEAARHAAGAPAVRRTGSPSSSRMLTSYLTGIEQQLDAHRREAALREALDLPRLAVALASPALRSDGAEIATWCAEWVRPPGADGDAHGLDHEPLARELSERAAQLAVAEPVPMRALRRLQLRRHVRTPPRGFAARRSGALPPRESAALQMCNALLEATRRWYARSGCHDLTVQRNLARLAVLR